MRTSAAMDVAVNGTRLLKEDTSADCLPFGWF